MNKSEITKTVTEMIVAFRGKEDKEAEQLKTWKWQYWIREHRN